MARPKWDLKAERELWADICAPKGDDTHPDALWWFLHIAWGAEWFMRQPGELRWLIPRVHKPYMHWLQTQILDWKKARREGRLERFYVAIIIPRGFGKTVTATKCASLWSHLDEPNMSTCIGSETHPKAKEFLASIKDVMSGKDKTSWFTWLYGNWYDPDRTWNREMVVHANRRTLSLTEPSFDTTGAETGITGYHPLEFFEDDPLSATKIREGGNWVEVARTSHNAAYPALRTDGIFFMVLTRYLDNDIAGQELRNRGILSWDGMPSPDERLSSKIGRGEWRVYYLQSRDVNGNITLPEVTTKRYLDAYELNYAKDYAAQYQNDPGTGEHMPLDKKQIPEMFISREAMREVPIEYATIHVDTAFKHDERADKGDFNVIAVLLHDLRANGKLYFDHAKVNDKWRVEEFNDELIKTLRDLANRRIRVRAIVDETEPGGKRGAWKLLMQKTVEGYLGRCPEIIQLPRQGTRKVERIRAAAGFWIEGWMKLVCTFNDKVPPHPEWGPWNPDFTPGLNELIHQMLRIGISTYDDVADAVADGFIEQVWRRPQPNQSYAREEGSFPQQPGDGALKDFGRKITNEEAADLTKTWNDIYGDDPIGDGNFLPDRY